MTAGAYPILSPANRSVAGGCALAMMIKAPRAGASKTRLCPPLRPEEAAALSACFLRDTTANIADAARATATPARGVAVYTPVGAEAAFDGLLPAGFALLAQREGSFGERLHGALVDLFACGFASVCLIDSDSPTLPRAALETAVAALARPGDRALFGASEDGGYYLLGLKKAHWRLFEAIDWSTERVAAQTLARAAEIGLEVERLPTWYDVDDASSLRALCAEFFDSARVGGYPAPHTRAFVERLLADDSDGRARLALALPD
ncbi:MAG: TIGR04282 family arsenosugar biosynthesis glycosyltransferase [Verrucomicrobia bacterium]|nr:TIGR04282 family arsenosugar biosynthesis glycosyltransferase [Verrucomicrobiota bacterium]MBV9657581.1 TIGR04282 family arsenosugar biosynthesis glycosyltransferase [Verrucomicrobiota bacterium]